MLRVTGNFGPYKAMQIQIVTNPEAQTLFAPDFRETCIFWIQHVQEQQRDGHLLILSFYWPRGSGCGWTITLQVYPSLRSISPRVCLCGSHTLYFSHIVGAWSFSSINPVSYYIAQGLNYSKIAYLESHSAQEECETVSAETRCFPHLLLRCASDQDQNRQIESP